MKILNQNFKYAVGLLSIAGLLSACADDPEHSVLSGKLTVGSTNSSPVPSPKGTPADPSALKVKTTSEILESMEKTPEGVSDWYFFGSELLSRGQTAQDIFKAVDGSLKLMQESYAKLSPAVVEASVAATNTRNNLLAIKAEVEKSLPAINSRIAEVDAKLEPLVQTYGEEYDSMKDQLSQEREALVNSRNLLNEKLSQATAALKTNNELDLKRKEELMTLYNKIEALSYFINDLNEFASGKRLSAGAYEQRIQSYINANNELTKAKLERIGRDDAEQDRIDDHVVEEKISEFRDASDSVATAFNKAGNTFKAATTTAVAKVNTLKGEAAKATGK